MGMGMGMGMSRGRLGLGGRGCNIGGKGLCAGIRVSGRFYEYCIDKSGILIAY